MATLVKIIQDGAAYEAAPAVLHIEESHTIVTDPSVALLNKLGYWPLEVVDAPTSEEGYRIFDDGYTYRVNEDGSKTVIHTYRKLVVVDPGTPTLADNQELIREYWETTDTEYIHHYVVVTLIDERPAEEEGKRIDDEGWVVDEDALTKTHVYKVRTVIDNQPALEEGQQIVGDWWEDSDDDTSVHYYKVMYVVDNPPELAEGQQIIASGYIDNEETNTRTHAYEVRYVVDNPPTLATNQMISRTYWEDDGITRTKIYDVHTYIDEPPTLSPGQEIVDFEWKDESLNVHRKIYTVRYVVDNGAPEMAANQFLHEEYWDDDGVTQTRVYDVWTNIDEQVPEHDAAAFRLVDLGVIDDPTAKTRGKKYFLKPIINDKPEDDPEGNFKYVFDYEQDTGSQIIMHYKKVAKVWRTFSKLKLEYAIFLSGKLAEFNTFLDSQTLTSPHGETASLRHFYELANVLDEKHSLFRPYLALAFTTLGFTTEAAEALLSQCTVDII